MSSRKFISIFVMSAAAVVAIVVGATVLFCMPPISSVGELADPAAALLDDGNKLKNIIHRERQQGVDAQQNEFTTSLVSATLMNNKIGVAAVAVAVVATISASSAAMLHPMIGKHAKSADLKLVEACGAAPNSTVEAGTEAGTESQTAVTLDDVAGNAVNKTNDGKTIVPQVKTSLRKIGGLIRSRFLKKDNPEATTPPDHKKDEARATESKNDGTLDDVAGKNNRGKTIVPRIKASFRKIGGLIRPRFSKKGDISNSADATSPPDDDKKDDEAGTAESKADDTLAHVAGNAGKTNRGKTIVPRVKASFRKIGGLIRPRFSKKGDISNSADATSPPDDDKKDDEAGTAESKADDTLARVAGNVTVARDARNKTSRRKKILRRSSSLNFVKESFRKIRGGSRLQRKDGVSENAHTVPTSRRHI